jgi:hypothetical protein
MSPMALSPGLGMVEPDKGPGMLKGNHSSGSRTWPKTDASLMTIRINCA